MADFVAKVCDERNKAPSGRRSMTFILATRLGAAALTHTWMVGAAQFTSTAPEKNISLADVRIAASIASSIALRTVADISTA
jgi:hypothetical protein